MTITGETFKFNENLENLPFNFRASCAAKRGPYCMMVAEKVDKGFLIMEDLKDPQRPQGTVILTNY